MAIIHEKNSKIPENAHRHETNNVLEISAFEITEEPIKIMKMMQIGKGKEDELTTDYDDLRDEGTHFPDTGAVPEGQVDIHLDLKR
jgi:hypothetical protein